MFSGGAFVCQWMDRAIAAIRNPFRALRDFQQPNANTFWSIANPPHAVWIAEWYRTPGFRPNETVWDRRYLSNDVWTHDQRILQYSGTFTGTWGGGGVSISIDPNVAEGPVAVPSGVDYIPPETKLSLEGQAGYEGWYKSPVKVTLTATDFYTGVKQIYYKISDDPWLPYSSPLTINRNGASHIYYRSLDNAGNWEDIQVKTIRIDTLPPENPSVISTGCQAYSGVPQPGAVTRNSPGMLPLMPALGFRPRILINTTGALHIMAPRKQQRWKRSLTLRLFPLIRDIISVCGHKTATETGVPGKRCSFFIMTHRSGRSSGLRYYLKIGMKRLEITLSIS